MSDDAHQAFDLTAYQSVLDAQVAELLQRVHADGERRCQQLLAAARLEAEGIQRGARKDARANVHQAVAEERARIEHSVGQHKAAEAMQERVRTEQSAQRLLAEMWQALPEKLQSRWRDPEHRRTWIEAAARQACEVLSGRRWRIEHGPDLTEAECRKTVEAVCNLTALQPASLECAVDAQITAGLRIRAMNTCLDATPAALLTDRPEIEASFLAEYGALRR